MKDDFGEAVLYGSPEPVKVDKARVVGDIAKLGFKRSNPKTKVCAGAHDVVRAGMRGDVMTTVDPEGLVVIGSAHI